MSSNNDNMKSAMTIIGVSGSVYIAVKMSWFRKNPFHVFSANTPLLELSYADDLIIFSGSIASTQPIPHAIQDEASLYNMHFNLYKTKIMHTNSPNTLDIYFRSTAQNTCKVPTAYVIRYLRTTANNKGTLRSHMGPKLILVKKKKVTEAAHSNVWIVKDKKIITHPANKEILKGVTRTVLKNMIKSLNLKLIEREFTINELLKAEEVFITSSGSLVTPITQVDKIKINKGKIGTITKSLALNLYKAII